MPIGGESHTEPASPNRFYLEFISFIASSSIYYQTFHMMFKFKDQKHNKTFPIRKHRFLFRLLDWPWLNAFMILPPLSLSNTPSLCSRSKIHLSYYFHSQWMSRRELKCIAFNGKTIAKGRRRQETDTTDRKSSIEWCEKQSSTNFIL